MSRGNNLIYFLHVMQTIDLDCHELSLLGCLTGVQCPRIDRRYEAGQKCCSGRIAALASDSGLLIHTEWCGVVCLSVCLLVTFVNPAKQLNRQKNRLG